MVKYEAMVSGDGRMVQQLRVSAAFAGARVRFTAPRSSGSQPPVTPAAAFYGHTHVHTHAHTRMHVHREKG